LVCQEAYKNKEIGKAKYEHKILPCRPALLKPLSIWKIIVPNERGRISFPIVYLKNILVSFDGLENRPYSTCGGEF